MKQTIVLTSFIIPIQRSLIFQWNQFSTWFVSWWIFFNCRVSGFHCLMEHVWLRETFFGSWPAESEHGILSTHFVNAQGAHSWPFRFNYCLCVRKCFAFLRGCLVAPQVFKSRFATQPVVLGSQLRGFGQTLTGMVLIAINAFAQFPSDVLICWLKTSVEHRLKHQTDAVLWQLRTCWKHSRKPCLFKLVGTHSKPCQNTEFGRLNSVVFIHARFFCRFCPEVFVMMLLPVLRPVSWHDCSINFQFQTLKLQSSPAENLQWLEFPNLQMIGISTFFHFGPFWTNAARCRSRPRDFFWLAAPIPPSSWRIMAHL